VCSLTTCDLVSHRRLRPTHGHRSATDLPIVETGCPRKGDRGWFPRSPCDRSISEAPSYTPAASPRLRRRPSPWPPHRYRKAASELTAPIRVRPRTAHRPISARFEPANGSRGVNHWFTHVAPADLASRTRTVWQCQSVPTSSGPLPTLPGVPRIRLPPTSPPCCDRTAAKVSHLHSITWRLVAHFDCR
jgi:hypothetical protein